MDRIDILHTFSYLRKISESMDTIERCKRKIAECEQIIIKSKPVVLKYAAKTGWDKLAHEKVEIAMETSKSCEQLAHELNVFYNQTELRNR